MTTTEMQQQAFDMPKKKEEGIHITNIVFRPLVRQSQDIQKWRTALILAESLTGLRIQLYELYEDIKLDPVLSDLMDKRILGVTKNKMIYVDENGEEIESTKDFVKKLQFRKLRKDIQLAKFWGITVDELIYENNEFRFYSVPRRNIRPRPGKIVYDQYGDDGIYYRDPTYSKYVLEVGDTEDLGLLLKAAPYVLWKRGTIGDWATFCEIFGMPFRKATWDGFNENTRLQLEEAMAKAGSAAYAVLPRDTEMEFLEAKNTATSGQVYDDLRKGCNQELSVLILGQTETTMKTAGSLGGNDDTHQKTEDEINADDREEELCIFNEKVKPILVNLGILKDGGSFTHKEEDVDLSPKDAVAIAIQLRNSGTPVSDDTMYRISTIEKPEEYDQLKADMQAEKEAERQPPPPGGGNKPPSKPKPKPAGAKNKLSKIDKFKLFLADFFDQARED